MKVEEITYDAKTGRPFLSQNDLEQLAYEFLEEFYSDVRDDAGQTPKPIGHCLQNPGKAPVDEVLIYLHETRGVAIGKEDLSGHPRHGVRAGIIFSRNTIYFNQQVLAEHGPVFRFAAAHEIAHWHLHRHKPLYLNDRTEPAKQIDDGDKELQPWSPGARKLVSTSDWIEFQANVFAAALLMPRPMVKRIVVEKQDRLGLSPARRGPIYVDKQPCNQHAFFQILSTLQDTFGVSKTCARIRLQRINILHEDP